VTDRIQVSAPGKLVVLGEYAVLFGAPAVVMAVDRRAVVTVEAAPGDSWSVAAPGLAADEVECAVAATGRVEWADSAAGARLSLFESVIGELVRRGLLDPTSIAPRRLVMDTTAFFDASRPGRPKFGLGSSAALTVALTSALIDRRPQPCPADLEWLQTLVELHRVVQGGFGSGIDVAASLCGGVVGYELDDAGSVAGIAPIRWPEKIVKLCVWTGSSASTRSFLDRLEASRATRAREVDEALDHLGQVSERGVDALARNDSFRFLDAVDRFWDALAMLGRVADMPILSDAHQRLRQVAFECGVHYKPSGAGGGDFGVCLSTDLDRIQDFSGRAREIGFTTPDVDVDLCGTLWMGR